MIQPQRIQLRRTKGFRLQEVSLALNGLAAVNCARPGRWGNPFVVGARAGCAGSVIWQFEVPLTSTEAIRLYRNWLKATEVGKAVATDARAELAGKNLACFCRLDKPCHCDVLLKLANPKGSER